MQTKSLSEKVYATLLKAFPRYYRETFGKDMLLAFRDMIEDNNALAVWFTVLKELPVNLTHEHLSTFKERKQRMNKRVLAIFSAITAGILLLLTVVPTAVVIPKGAPIVTLPVVTGSIFLLVVYLAIKRSSRSNEKL